MEPRGSLVQHAVLLAAVVAGALAAAAALIVTLLPIDPRPAWAILAVAMPCVVLGQIGAIVAINGVVPDGVPSRSPEAFSALLGALGRAPWWSKAAIPAALIVLALSVGAKDGRGVASTVGGDRVIHRGGRVIERLDEEAWLHEKRAELRMLCSALLAMSSLQVFLVMAARRTLAD